MQPLDVWPMPTLDRAGQEAFWNRQASTYGLADMTRDNVGELAIVEALCRDFAERGYVAKDVVALGGANGCRDPLVVTRALQKCGREPQQIFFNDLSVAMTKAAWEGSLTEYEERGIPIQVLPGPIHEIASQIPVLPRRLVVGAYSAHALVEINPQEDYPYTGLEEYVRNKSILGDRFIVEPVSFKDGECFVLASPLIFLTEQASERLGDVLASLKSWLESGEVGAFRVTGQHSNEPGFFLSHWFTEAGILELVRSSFAHERLHTMRLLRCDKGFVLCIDPIERPQGIITLLNNVIGNVLPHEQAETLRAIDRLST